MQDVERVALALCRATSDPGCDVVCSNCRLRATAAMRETLLIAAEALRQEANRQGYKPAFGHYEAADWLKGRADEQ